MSKDKLISLIIRKQTYKDTKAYLTDLLNLKQDAAKTSHQAIKQILTTDYNAEAKLYAVRYLKDAFEKGNPSFINLVEKDILPILINISIDENDEKAHIKYAGSSYTKAEELSKFKAIVSSMFRMVKECIIKWAEWIPDPNRKFAQGLTEIKKRKISLNFQWKYFRPENQQLFKQCCQKNGIKLGGGAQPKSLKSTKKVQKPPPKDPLLIEIQKAFQNIKVVSSQKDLVKVENDFNEAINNYLENAQNFSEELVQRSFDDFQRQKKEAVNRIKGGQPQKVKQSATPMPKDHASSPQKSPTKEQKSLEKPKAQKSRTNIPQSSILQSNIPQQKQKVAEAPIQNKEPKPKQKISSTSNKDIPVKQEEKIVQKVLRKNSQLNIIKEVIEEKKSQIKKVEQSSQPPKKEEIKVEQPLNIKITITSPRARQEKQQTIIAQQEIKKVQVNPIIRSNKILKQQTIPTSPKRGPIKFEENQSPFTSQKYSMSLKEESKNAALKQSKQEGSSRKEKKLDVPASKQESERIHFSDQDSSDFSKESQLEPRDFKKKAHLTPIKEETQRAHQEDYTAKSSARAPTSRINEEESFTHREKKGAVTHKLMEQNKQLMEKYQKMIRQLEASQQQKLTLLKEKDILDKQLRNRAENDDKLSKRVKNSVPMEDYNRLRKELEQQRGRRQSMLQEMLKMKSANESLIEELNQTKYRLKNQQNDKSRQRVSESFTNTLNINPKQSVKSFYPDPPIIKQDLDQDYIKNLTHTSNLHNLLNKVNLNLFKRNSLQQSQIFYRDEYVSIMAKSRVYTENDEQFVSVSMTFQFKSLKQVKPQVKYKNCQQLDLWSKPLTGEDLLYTQQLAIRLDSNPLKVIKAQVKIIETIDIMFLLPILYMNFLREEEFSNDQFEDIFVVKAQHLIKSKITQWNSEIIKQVVDMHKIFKRSVVVADKIRFCLSEGINDQIFMAQLQILRNNKFLLRVLPIPYSQSMISKAKQLIENIIFLLS